MATRRSPARDVAQDRGGGEFWIDHAKIGKDDSWLRSATWLTLWNVTVPAGVLAQLPDLWGLDLRGGSATDLRVVEGCGALRCLVVNQMRGLADLSILPTLTTLELLDVYGLRQVTAAPSLATLPALRRLQVGQMRGLAALDGFLDAPGLEELQLHKWVNVAAEDVTRIKAHPTLTHFGWHAFDVPDSRWLPVVEAVALPNLQPSSPGTGSARRAPPDSSPRTPQNVYRTSSTRTLHAGSAVASIAWALANRR